MGSICNPRGCGGSIRGGGTAGPRGDTESVLAGDDGEYHHSKNLMKKMAVGSRIFKLSSKSRGDDMNNRRSRANKVTGEPGGGLRCDTCLAAS